MDYPGNAIERYTYDAFGQATVADGNGNYRGTTAYGNRFMFTGREWIAALGAYDYRNRMYSPQLGRFLQPDPTGFAAGDMNLFRYCGGDPVNRVDPFGLASAHKPQSSPPVPTRPVNGIGNSNDPNSPRSLDGWWSNPDGTPTGTGGSGPGDPSQGGGGGSDDGSLTLGLIWQTPRVVVTPSGSFFSNVNATTGDFGFRPGQVSTTGGSKSAWFNIPTQNLEPIRIDAARLTRFAPTPEAAASMMQFRQGIIIGTDVYLAAWGVGPVLLPAIGDGLAAAGAAIISHPTTAAAAIYTTSVLAPALANPAEALREAQLLPEAFEEITPLVIEEWIRHH